MENKYLLYKNMLKEDYVVAVPYLCEGYKALDTESDYDLCASSPYDAYEKAMINGKNNPFKRLDTLKILDFTNENSSINSFSYLLNNAKKILVEENIPEFSSKIDENGCGIHNIDGDEYEVDPNNYIMYLLYSPEAFEGDEVKDELGSFTVKADIKEKDPKDYEGEFHTSIRNNPIMTIGNGDFDPTENIYYLHKYETDILNRCMGEKKTHVKKLEHVKSL